MSESRARLSLVLLLYFLGVTGVIALAPFEFAIPADVNIAFLGDWHAVVTTGLLFVPLGFLFPLTRGGSTSARFLVATLAFLLGGTIEAAHLLQPNREASIAAVIAAVLGAEAGALLLRAVNRRIRRSTWLAGRLSLELPLLALVYLLLPLLIASSLAAAGEPLRMIALLPLALLGARLMSAVHDHHFGPAGVFRRGSIAVVAAGWTALGTFPVLLGNPFAAIGLALLVGLTTAHEASTLIVQGGGTERRFEAAVLRGATPYIAVYITAAIFLPLANGVTNWHLALGLTGSNGDLAQQMIRALEPIAGLTVLGYVMAEARGRHELAFRSVATRIATECIGVALVMEWARGFQLGAGASVLRFALMIGASMLGAGIYHHQRERVRLILIHRASRHVRS